MTKKQRKGLMQKVSGKNIYKSTNMLLSTFIITQCRGSNQNVRFNENILYTTTVSYD